jgi:hypothetical protein
MVANIYATDWLRKEKLINFLWHKKSGREFAETKFIEALTLVSRFLNVGDCPWAQSPCTILPEIPPKKSIINTTFGPQLRIIKITASGSATTVVT